MAGPGYPGTGIIRSYDAFGRQTNFSLQIGGIQAQSVVHSFDTAGRLFSVSDGMNTATYTYGADGATWTNLSFGGPLTTRRTFDGLNRLSQIASTPSNDTAISFAYTLNQANQRTTNTLADGGKWVYQYDGLGQVISGKKAFADGQPVQGAQFGYEFDTIGNRTSSENTFGSTNLQETYTANELNQYTQRTVPGVIPVTGEADSEATVTVRLNTNIAVMANRHDEYFWKALNVTNSAALFATTNLQVRAYKTVGTNSLVRTEIRNAVVPKTPEAFMHDLDGNLVSDGLWTNYWSAENRLTQMVSLASVPDDQKKKLVFGYDYIGRRVSKTALSGYTGGNYSTTNTTIFLWTGWSMLGEIRNNQTTNLYVWGLDLSGTLGGAGDVGGLLFTALGTNAYCVAFDGNGNVMGLVDAAGNIAAKYQYGAFGECLEATGPAASANAVRFSTKYWDTETGLGYWGYRYYSPAIGRWLSRDPIGEWGGIGLYVFVSNDPTDKRDSLGLYAITEKTVGVEDCGVIVLATHNFNVSSYKLDNAGCRRAAIVTCMSASKVPPVATAHPWEIVGIPLSSGFVGDTTGNGVNAGFGEGAAGFIKYMKYVLNAARASAEALCPSDTFLSGEKIEDPETKKKCDPCELYRSKASGSEKGFFAYGQTTYRCCHCKKITLVLRSPMPGDLTTLAKIMSGSDWMKEIGAGSGSTAVYDCKKKKWTGTAGLYKSYDVALPSPPSTP